MSTSIDTAFIQQFESEVHLAYQRTGSKLRGTVRYKSGVIGSSTNFQKTGKGVAGTKGRHGEVPVMNVTHTVVNCPVADYYAGDWVDALDELKTNIDERSIVANSGAYALGRKTDSLITTAWSASNTQVVNGGTGLDKTKVLKAFETINTADVPDDGDRFFVVSPQCWNHLLNVTEFANSQYVGTDGALPFTMGVTAKQWLGATFFQFTGLPKASTIRSNFLFHRSSTGLAVGSDVKSDITWHGDRAAHFINNSMSMGSVVIDSLGVIMVDAVES